MRMVVLGMALCVALHSSAAFGLSASASPSTGRRELLPKTGATSTTPQPKKLRDSDPNRSAGALNLAPPTQSEEKDGATSQTLRSVVAGESTINPWFPGRGSIGVQVNLSW